MQGPHNLFDTRIPIPPMDVEQVDIIGPESLEGLCKGKLQRLGVVSRKEDFVRVERRVVQAKVVRILPQQMSKQESIAQTDD